MASEKFPQQTLQCAVTVSGVALHSGVDVEVTLHPAPRDHGIRFRRIDLADAPEIAVGPQTLEAGQRCTALRNPSAGVRTVEHLLAVTYALGIDNLLIDISAEEMPILDGSAAPWLAAVDSAGIAACDGEARVIDVVEPVLVSVGETHLLALPSPQLRVSAASVTAHPVAGSQAADIIVTPERFRSTLATARTFCYLEEVEALRAAGLARGGSLENAIVVMPDGYSSPLRMPNELAAHKALDLLGDLATLGLRLRAHVVAVKPGHAANQQLVKAIWSQYCCGQSESLKEGIAPSCGMEADNHRPVTVR